MTEKDKQNWAVLALGVGFAYFGVLDPILKKLGLKEDPNVKETEARKKKQLNDAINTAVKKTPLTKSVQEWQIIADQIYDDLRYTSLDDNKADATYQAARVQNDADFLMLFKLFGKRREYAFGLPAGGVKDLGQFIKSNLSAKQIGQLNWNYKNKGIHFKY